MDGTETRRCVVRALGAGVVVGLTGCANALDRTGRGGGNSGSGETRLDERGTMEISIDDGPVDLTADRFQAEHASDHSMAFHFHEFDEYWYMEGFDRVTFAEAVDQIPQFAYESVDGAHVVTYDETTYDECTDGTRISFFVGGEAVDPIAYELQDGDHLLVEIATTMRPS